MRFFNTAGPVTATDHYCLPPLERFDLAEVLLLIEQKKYFVLHAPRQTGKTSCLLALMDYLNYQDTYQALYVNVEVGQSAREDVRRGIRAILSQLASMARDVLDDGFLDNIWPDILARSGEDTALNEVLTQWAAHSAKPLVLLLDEIDALVGDTLIAVLRQLRAGYPKRPQRFPQSIVLCGVRDVRDYRFHTDPGKSLVTGGSAFNVRAASLRLGNFSLDDVTALYAQHTADTGQVFHPEALAYVWTMTQGQPWLVNALGYEACFTMPAGRQRVQPITAELLTEAKERLILRRETHLDQLMDKLAEERVRRVLEPLLVGSSQPDLIPTDDILYVEDLGLITTTDQLRIANPIYQEIIPRELTYSTQLTIAQQSAWYLQADGHLDMRQLLSAFQDFFRQHAEHWIERFDYKEAGPQLLMQAFLQRIVNGGGRVEREYGLGRMRTDLLVIWPHATGVQKVVIELKLRYGALETTLAAGVAQTHAYMDICQTDEGHLVIFDRIPHRSWQDKIFCREDIHQGKRIVVWGM